MPKTSAPRNLPSDFPQVTPCVFYADPRAALEWLGKAFGFTTRVCVTNGEGSVIHSEMECGAGVIQVGPVHGSFASPRSLNGACTQSVCVYVEDVDALYERARAAGALVHMEIADKKYGDRSFGVLDLEGHVWWFAQRVDEDAWRRSTLDYRTAESK